jgi:hypothetical protein
MAIEPTNEYPQGFYPNHTEALVTSNKIIPIPALHLKFDHWAGEKIQNTFGGKPIINYEGKPMFAELAIMNMVLKAGWSSRWVEAYGSGKVGPLYFSEWVDAPLKKQIVRPLDSEFHLRLLARIASANRNSYKGCWDVLAWSGEKTLFIESKHYKKDSIRDSQIRWLLAGLSAGLKPTNFLIAQWDFD